MNKLAIAEKQWIAIIEVGNGLGVKPETIANNLEKYLPNPLAKKIYMELAVSYNLNVQDCAKMLTVIGHPYKLHEDDDEWVPVGENLVVNKADKLRNDLILSLELNCKNMRDSSGIEMNKATSVAMVLLFGDVSETIVGDLYAYLLDIKTLFFSFKQMDSLTKSEVTIDKDALRRAVLFIVRCAWSDIDRGRHVSLDAEDYIDRMREMKYPELKEMQRNITWEDLSERYDLEL